MISQFDFLSYFANVIVVDFLIITIIYSEFDSLYSCHS